MTMSFDHGAVVRRAPELENNVERGKTSLLSSAPPERGGTVRNARASSSCAPSVVVVEIVGKAEPGFHRPNLLAADSMRYTRGSRTFLDCF